MRVLAPAYLIDLCYFVLFENDGMPGKKMTNDRQIGGTTSGSIFCWTRETV